METFIIQVDYSHQRLIDIKIEVESHHCIDIFDDKNIFSDESVPEDNSNPKPKEELGKLELEDSTEKLKAEKIITELTENNIKLQREKDELAATIDSFKFTLMEYYSNMPILLPEEGIVPGTDEKGIIILLANLIQHNRDLKNNFFDFETETENSLKSENEILRQKYDEL